jgi:phytoene dehydrogenase-like protein
MSSRVDFDAVVVGSGPNGLSAAIRLAQTGWSVAVLEAADTIGGGVRSAELTLSGFIHDTCSAILPLSVASPFLRTLPLSEFGLDWIHAPVQVAHPLNDGSALLLERSLEATARQFGVDASRYRSMIAPFLDRWQDLLEDIQGPLPLLPGHPLTLARFGLAALPSARMLANTWFSDIKARAAFAGHAAHSVLPLESPGTAAAGVLMSIFVHTVGWPMVKGGAGNLSKAMGEYLESLGGVIQTGFLVKGFSQLPPARAYLFDLTPTQLSDIAGSQLPVSYRRKLSRYRYGPGVFKLDYALSEPVPWTAGGCAEASTVHLGGTFDEIAHSEKQVWLGGHPEKPFVLFVQQTPFDSDRAPEGKHTAWAYCHVPNGSTKDMTGEIENQIERFAPGFRDTILARHTFNTRQMQEYNNNYQGGDIIGGVQDLRQQFFRPVVSLNPYRTPAEGIYICSSSTPPGGGVHGMSGYHAAEAVLKDHHLA